MLNVDFQEDERNDHTGREHRMPDLRKQGTWGASLRRLSQVCESLRKLAQACASLRQACARFAQACANLRELRQACGKLAPACARPIGKRRILKTCKFHC